MPKPASTRPAYKMLTCIYLCRTLLFFAPYADFYVKNSYYIRCGNITLGYTLPLKKKFLQSCRIYADINNPFIITNWTGLDPETDNGTYAYPNITSYSLGINIKF